MGATEGPRLEPYLGHWPVVDPSAWVHPSAVLIGRVAVGPEATIWPHACLRGDDGTIAVGARSNIQDGCVLHTTEQTQVVVGERVTVGHKVILHGCRVGDDTMVGMGSLLMDDVVIGDHCFVGAGTLLTQRTEIPPRSMVYGWPGRVVRAVTDEELAWIDYGWRRYVDHCHSYRERDAG